MKKPSSRLGGSSSRSPLVNINGQWVLPNKAVIPIFDSAFLYGEGLFATMQARAGRILFLAHHLKRLRNNARFLHWPPLPSEKKFTQLLDALLRKNHCHQAIVRIHVSRGTTSPEKFHQILWTQPFPPYPKRFYQRGMRVILIRGITNDAPPLSLHKTSNYLTKILARYEVKRNKADEGLLLNHRGELTEGTSSSLFLVKTGRLYTPPLASGCLPGITRSLVLKAARNMALPTQEKRLTPSDLFAADEAFFTSSLKDIMPIATCDGKPIGGPQNPWTRRLTAVYQEFIGQEIRRPRP